MKQFIEGFMERVCADFEKSITIVADFQVFRDFGYTQEQYRNGMIQQYYLLRYFPAYLFEYFHIYDRMMAENLVKPPLNVLSIGAGCGIDYYGLHFALQRHPEYNTALRWTGVDSVKWEYSNELPRESVRHIEANITHRNRLACNDYNVIIFPKSLNEFGDDGCCAVQELIAKSKFVRNPVCLIASDPEKTAWLDVIADRLAKTSGRKRGNAIATPSEFTVKNRAVSIRAYMQKYHPTQWTYPTKAENLLRELPNLCPTFRKKGEEHCGNRCDEKLCKNPPILSTYYTRYRVEYLEH